jgi:polyphenol oxidase
MEPFVLKNESLLTIDGWMNTYSGLTAGITSKHGGVSKGSYKSLNMGFHVGDIANDVCRNRETVANLLDFPLKNWVGAQQTHDIVIRKISKNDRGLGANSYDRAFKGVDGFYTNETGILLTLCFADCVPLFFLAPQSRMVGAAHAGWKGTVGGIARAMITNWEQEGIRPEDIFVAIGPSICKHCYIVDNRVINLVENILEDVDGKPYNLINGNQYCLDLREANRLILLKAGVPEDNIVVTDFCTSCDNMFFSHRRDQGDTGRILSYIGWKEI